MPSSRTPRSLKTFVKARRQELGLSAYEAARRARLHPSYWSKLEAGRYDAPHPKSLQGIADALEVPLQDLYALVGYQPAEELPPLRPYLRAKYQLPPHAVSDLERYFDFLRHHYGIPDNEPVFPPKPKAPLKQKAASTPTARSKRRAA